MRAVAPRRWLFAASLVVAVLLVLPQAARAQSVKPTQGAVIQETLPGGQATVHPNNVDATWISYADCENDVRVVVPLTLAPDSSGSFSGYQLQAWASSAADCVLAANRGGTAGLCWQALGSDIQPGPSITVPVHVRDMVKFLGTSSAGIDPDYPSAGEDACHAITTSGAVPLTLQFVWFHGPANAVNSLQVGLNVEMIGPAPPSGVDAGIGDGLLRLSWTPQNDPTTKGFNIFIDPLPGHEGPQQPADASEAASTTDSGSGHQVQVCQEGGVTDGGLDDTGDVIEIPVDGGCVTETVLDAEPVPTASTTCPSTILVSGVTGTGTGTPSPTGDSGNAASEAGTTVTVTGTAPSAAALALVYQTIGDGTATSATIAGLKDGFNYTVAISAIDNLNDNGPLSVPACQIPQPIDDFWKKYTAAGGQAGGGFCALEGPGVPVSGSIFSIGMAAAAFAWARRRRRGR
jgi:hypothetical protein